MAKKQHGGSRPGSGRKTIHPEGATVTVAAKVPAALVEQLDDVADQRGLKRSQAITEAIRELVASHKRNDVLPPDPKKKQSRKHSTDTK